MKHFLLSLYNHRHHGCNWEQQRCMQLRKLISVELFQCKSVTQNSQKNKSTKKERYKERQNQETAKERGK